MAKKNFDNVAEAMFSGIIDKKTKADIPSRVAAEPEEKNTEKKQASSLLIDILRERKTERKSLILRPSTLKYAKKQAKTQGKSFNDYIEDLIINEMQK